MMAQPAHPAESTGGRTAVPLPQGIVTMPYGGQQVTRHAEPAALAGGRREKGVFPLSRMRPASRVLAALLRFDVCVRGVASRRAPSQAVYFTEMHLDLFRIVNEHVELGLSTAIEVLLFNLLIGVGDFVADVQSMLLLRLRQHWRRLSFVYLCALVNNCARCIELWEQLLRSCTVGDHPGTLSEPLVRSLHLGYVIDGFVNLSRSAMQLASHQVTSNTRGFGRAVAGVG